MRKNTAEVSQDSVPANISDGDREKFSEQAYAESQALLSEFRSMYFSRQQNEEARNSLSLISTSISDLKSEFNETSKIIDNYFKSLSESIEVNFDKINTVTNANIRLQEIQNGVGNSLNELSEVANTISSRVSLLTDSINSNSEKLETVANTNSQLQEIQNGVDNSLNELYKTAGTLSNKVNFLSNSIDNNSDKFDAVPDSDVRLQEIQSGRNSLDQLSDAVSMLATKVDSVKKMNGRLEAIHERVMKSVVHLTNTVDALARKHDEGVESVVAFSKFFPIRLALYKLFRTRKGAKRGDPT
jgi:DNA repair ATPase RecN